MARVLHKLYEYAVGQVSSEDEDSSSCITDSSEESRMRRRERAREKKIQEDQRKRTRTKQGSSKEESHSRGTRTSSHVKSSSHSGSSPSSTNKRISSSYDASSRGDRRNTSTATPANTSKKSASRDSGTHHRRLKSTTTATAGKAASLKQNISRSSSMDGKNSNNVDQYPSRHYKSETTGRRIPSSLKKGTGSAAGNFDMDDDSHASSIQATNDEAQSVFGTATDDLSTVASSVALNDYSTMSRYIRRSKSSTKSVPDPRADLLHSVSETDEYNYHINAKQNVGTYIHHGSPSLTPNNNPTHNNSAFEIGGPMMTTATFDTQDTRGTYTAYNSNTPIRDLSHVISFDAHDDSAATDVYNGRFYNGSMYPSSHIDVSDTRQVYNSYESGTMATATNAPYVSSGPSSYPIATNNGVAPRRAHNTSSNSKATLNVIAAAESVQYASAVASTIYPPDTRRSINPNNTSSGIDARVLYNSYENKTEGNITSTIYPPDTRRSINSNNTSSGIHARVPYNSYENKTEENIAYTSASSGPSYLSNGIDTRGSYNPYNNAPVMSAASGDKNVASNVGSFYSTYLGNTFDTFETHPVPDTTNNISMQHPRYPVVADAPYGPPINKACATQNDRYSNKVSSASVTSADHRSSSIAYLPILHPHSVAGLHGSNNNIDDLVRSAAVASASRPMPKKRLGSQSFKMSENPTTSNEELMPLTAEVQFSNAQGDDENSVSTIQMDLTVSTVQNQFDELNNNVLKDNRTFPQSSSRTKKNATQAESENNKPFRETNKSFSGGPVKISSPIVEKKMSRYSSISDLVETFPALSEKKKTRHSNSSSNAKDASQPVETFDEKKITRYTGSTGQSAEVSSSFNEKKTTRLDIIRQLAETPTALVEKNLARHNTMPVETSPVSDQIKSRYESHGQSSEMFPARLSVMSDDFCYSASEQEGSMAYSVSDVASKGEKFELHATSNAEEALLIELLRQNTPQSHLQMLELLKRSPSIPADTSFSSNESDITSADEREGESENGTLSGLKSSESENDATETSSLTLDEEEKSYQNVERSNFARDAINFLKTSPQNNLVRDILKKSLSPTTSLSNLSDPQKKSAGLATEEENFVINISKTTYVSPHNVAQLENSIESSSQSSLHQPRCIFPDASSGSTSSAVGSEPSILGAEERNTAININEKIHIIPDRLEVLLSSENVHSVAAEKVAAKNLSARWTAAVDHTGDPALSEYSLSSEDVHSIDARKETGDYLPTQRASSAASNSAEKVAVKSSSALWTSSPDHEADPALWDDSLSSEDVHYADAEKENAKSSSAFCTSPADHVADPALSEFFLPSEDVHSVDADNETVKSSPSLQTSAAVLISIFPDAVSLSADDQLFVLSSKTSSPLSSTSQSECPRHLASSVIVELVSCPPPTPSTPPRSKKMNLQVPYQSASLSAVVESNSRDSTSSSGGMHGSENSSAPKLEVYAHCLSKIKNSPPPPPPSLPPPKSKMGPLKSSKKESPYILKPPTASQARLPPAAAEDLSQFTMKTPLAPPPPPSLPPMIMNADFSKDSIKFNLGSILAKRRTAAKSIQRVARKWIYGNPEVTHGSNAHNDDMRLSICIAKIQLFYRRRLFCLKFLRRALSAVQIQKTWRRLNCRRELLWVLEQEYSVCAIQTFCRVALHRMRFTRARSACLTLQTIFRSSKVKSGFKIESTGSSSIAEPKLFETNFGCESSNSVNGFPSESEAPSSSNPAVAVWDGWGAFADFPGTSVNEDLILSTFSQDAFLEREKKGDPLQFETHFTTGAGFKNLVTDENVEANKQKTSAFLSEQTIISQKNSLERSVDASAIVQQHQGQAKIGQIHVSVCLNNQKNGSTISSQPSIPKDQPRTSKKLRPVPYASKIADSKEDDVSSFGSKSELSDSAWDKFDDEDEGKLRTGSKNRRIARVHILKQLFPSNKPSSRKVKTSSSSAETKIQYIPPRIDLSPNRSVPEAGRDSAATVLTRAPRGNVQKQQLLNSNSEAGRDSAASAVTRSPRVIMQKQQLSNGNSEDGRDSTANTLVTRSSRGNVRKAASSLDETSSGDEPGLIPPKPTFSASSPRSMFYSRKVHDEACEEKF